MSSPVVAYIEWVDAGTAASGWTDRADALEKARTMIATPIRTAGLLIDQNDDYVVVAVSENGTADDLAHVMAIPRAGITRMERWRPWGEEGT